MTVNTSEYQSIVTRINAKYSGDIRKGNDFEHPERISTGSLELDVAMGGGIPIGRWSRFYGSWHCLAPGTQILRADMSWTAIENLQAGDEIVGFDEYAPGGRGRQRQLRRAIVVDNPVKRLPSHRVLTDQGTETIASADHLWLTSTSRPDGHAGLTRWKRTDELLPGDRILWFAKPWSQLHGVKREAAAYLGGLFDGEGSIFNGRICFYQNQGIVLDNALKLLDDVGFPPVAVGVYANRNGLSGRVGRRVSVGSTVAESMRFLSHVPAERLRANAGTWWEGREIVPKGRYRSKDSCYATVVSNESVGECEVFAIGTTTQTLIADGMLSHNSGKTLRALQVIKHAQQLGMLCAYYNIEKQYDPVFAAHLGVNIDQLTLVEGATIEEITDKMEALFSVCHLHVIDSCTMAVSEDELECDVRDWRPGIQARAWGKAFKRLNERFDQRDNTVLMIDQARINFQTQSEQAAGGRILDHQSSMTIHFKKGSWLHRDEHGFLSDSAKQAKGLGGAVDPAGYQITARVDKSRVGRPFRAATARFDLDALAFDELFEEVKAAKYYGLVESKKGGYYYDIDTGELLCQGEPQLRQYLVAHPEFRAQIRERALTTARHA